MRTNHLPSIAFAPLLMAAVCVLQLPAFGAAGRNAWGDSIISMQVTRNAYDLQQPWSKIPRTFIKTCIVIAPGELLSTAEDLFDRTLVRVQKSGRGPWWTADVTWVDYHANLALLTVKDASFWKGLQPLELASGPLDTTKLQVARWKSGNLEMRKVDFNQYTVDDARLSFINSLYMEFDSEMTGIGGAAPVLIGRKVAAITCEQTENHVRAIPAAFIRGVLDAKRKNRWTGLGYFPFYWQPTENASTHAFLKLPGEPRGVVVSYVPPNPEIPENLKARDIILQVDGFDITPQGYYQDPLYGQLILENLATRNKFAGDIVKIKVWREGREEVVNYRLPKADYSSRLVPEQAFDHEPEYMIVGGLVFQPLNKPYLKSFGSDWRKSAPFRLSYFDREDPTPARPSLVVLSVVLPDAYNIGYQDLRALVVDRVNGRKISKLADLKKALEHPAGGYHVIEFIRSDSLRRIMLDAATEPDATARVLNAYHIPKAAFFAAETSAKN